VRSRALFIAATLSLLAAAEEPVTLGDAGFLRFTEWTGHGSPAYEEILGESKIVLEALPELATLFVEPESEDGTPVDLSGLQPTEEGSAGVWLEIQDEDPSFLETAPRRKRYDFVRWERLSEPYVARRVGTREAQIAVRVREALPLERSWTSPPVVVPPSAVLSLSIALQSEWRANRESGSRFVVQVLREGKTTTLLDETLWVWQERMDKPQWHDHRLELEEFAAQTVRFRLRSESAPGAPEPSLAFPLWGDPVLLAEVERPRGDSLLFISLDTLRADHLGSLGDPHGLTPNLDAFAEEGVLFEQARAPAGMTTPSHASAFTGLSPAQHRAGIVSEGFVVEPRWTMLAERMRASGRITAAFTEGVAVRGNIGFRRGFDHYSDGGPAERPRHGLAPETFDGARAWLKAHGRHPFFLFVHTYACHSPYDPPQAWLERFVDPEYDGPPLLYGRDGETPEQQEHIRQRYRAGVAYADHLFGEFMAYCRDAGILDTTTVVVFSDHGEEFWEKGGYGHTYSLYETLLRVPILVRPAGGLEEPVRVKAPVQLSDLYATALDVVSIEVDIPPNSIALTPFWGASTGAYERDAHYAYFKFPAREADGEFQEWDMLAVLSDGYKRYLRGEASFGEPESAALPEVARTSETYRVADDPMEQVDLSGEEASRDERLDRLILEWLSRELEAREAAGEADRDGLSEEDIEALRGLGYL